KRFKNPDDPLRLVIVRDMWLTGFDVPCLTTMYADKPMRGHGLMQAIARVNRVFKDKPGGLIVDYIGLADNLRKALATYTDGEKKSYGIENKEEAVAVMLEKYQIIVDILHGFDYLQFVKGSPAQKMSGMVMTSNYVLSLEDGKKRFIKGVTDLSKAFALSCPHEKTKEISDEVGFFQGVRATLLKTEPKDGQSTREDMESAIRQLVSKSVVPGGVVDVFAQMGLKSQDISILSDEFLEEVRDIPHRNLAMELLQKLLKDDIKSHERRNLVQARSFAEMLEKAILAYQNRSLETAEVIAELISLAKEMREANRRGEQLGLSDDEVAFYDALEVNDSAVKVLGDDTLKVIARELVEAVRKNATIDWNLKESAKAKMRVIIRRLLRKHGYPPDKQDTATETVIKQAELLCRGVAA
ncbi:MAG: DUF3387 domain-containing protein, partial [Deltaproteobacteria bacterium]|nr:DUF3387 domain-containing protein [Deltaproteobacteria bacterium]